MSLTTTAGYTVTDPDTLTTTKLNQLGAPTVPDNQTYYFASGTISAPGVSFNGDTNTGLYRIGADNIGLVCGATLAQSWTTSGVVITAGTITGCTTIAAASGGVFKLGNAAAAGSITPTHTVTIQDSTGTSYKIAVQAA